MKNPLQGILSRKPVQQMENPIPTPNQKKSIPINYAVKYFQYGESLADPIFRPLGSYSQFVSPKVSFKRMINVYEDDPEIQFGLDFSVAVSVGAGHYFTAKTDALANYVEQFAKDINLDFICQTAGRETLGYGNSIWQYIDLYRDPKAYDVIKQLPLSSLQRIWWNGFGTNATIDHYEFQGYTIEKLLPQELIHFRWRVSDASPFGLGVIQPLVTQVQYTYNKAGEDETRERMSIIDIKRSVQDMLHKSLRRYQRRVIYNLKNAQPSQAQAAQSTLDTLDDEQDFVIPGEMQPFEIGAMARAMDTESFEKIYSNEIIKALGTPTSRLYEKGALTEASAQSAKQVALMNLMGFQRQMKRMIERLIIKPWYQANPLRDANGVIIPWTGTGIELNWGINEKPEMNAQDFASLVSQLMPGPKKEEMIYKYLAHAGIEVNSEENNASLNR
ncbi:MAG: hypothetical protein AB1299_09275 [Thermoproteota archaeon]